MKFLRTPGPKSLINAVLLVLSTMLVSTPAHADLIPINAWIHDPVIASVSISPNGNKLVALTLSNINEAPDVTVWDTRNISAAPKRFRPEDSKSLFVTWLNNERLLVVGRQKFDYRIGGKVTRWFRDKA